jgi:hypothetical protein
MSKLFSIIALLMVMSLTGCIRFTYIQDSEGKTQSEDVRDVGEDDNRLESIIEDGVDTIKQGKVGVEIYKDF